MLLLKNAILKKSPNNSVSINSSTSRDNKDTFSVQSNSNPSETDSISENKEQALEAFNKLLATSKSAFGIVSVKFGQGTTPINPSTDNRDFQIECNP
jgi:hypothetical protein